MKPLTAMLGAFFMLRIAGFATDNTASQHSPVGFAILQKQQ